MPITRRVDQSRCKVHRGADHREVAEIVVAHGAEDHVVIGGNADADVEKIDAEIGGLVPAGPEPVEAMDDLERDPNRLRGAFRAPEDRHHPISHHFVHDPSAGHDQTGEQRDVVAQETLDSLGPGQHAAELGKAPKVRHEDGEPLPDGCLAPRGQLADQVVADFRLRVQTAAGQHLLEEARVMDRDGRLGPEPGGQLDVPLLVGFGPAGLVEELHDAIADLAVAKRYTDHRPSHELGLPVQRLVVIVELVLYDGGAGQEDLSGLGRLDRDVTVSEAVGDRAGGGREDQVVAARVVEDHRPGRCLEQPARQVENGEEGLLERVGGGQRIGGIQQGEKLPLPER